MLDGLVNGHPVPAPLFLNPKEPVRFEPEGQDKVPAEERRAYMLRVPTGADRPHFRQRVIAEGARTWGLPAQIDALMTAVRRQFVDDADEQQPRLDMLQEWRDRITAYVERLNAGEWEVPTVLPEESAKEDPEIAATIKAREDAGTAAIAEPEGLSQLLFELGGTAARYHAMIGDNVVYSEIRGRVACQMFLVDWEGPELPTFRRTKTVLPDPMLDCIPTEHLDAIGARIAELLEPDGRRVGNSTSSPGGATAPATSTPTSSATPETPQPDTETGSPAEPSTSSSPATHETS